MIKLRLDDQMVGIIGLALRKAPISVEVAMPVLEEMQKQINAQQPQAQAKPSLVKTDKVN